MSNYSLNDLMVFLAVVDTGQVSRAAQRLGVTQPSVSKAIQRLEREVGESLLQRGAQGSQLTASGQVFLESARKLRAQHVDLQRVVAELRAQRAGYLRLGLTNPSGDDLATRALARLLGNRPGLRVQLVLGRSDTLREQVLEGKLEAAIVPTYPGFELPTGATVIGQDQVQVVVRLGHPLLELSRPQLADLVPYPWISPGRDSAARQYLVRVFQRAGLPEPQVALETDYPSHATMGVVARSDLLCLTPSVVERAWLDRVRPVTIGALQVQRQIVMLTHPEVTWTPMLRALRDTLAELQRQR